MMNPSEDELVEVWYRWDMSPSHATSGARVYSPVGTGWLLGLLTLPGLDQIYCWYYTEGAGGAEAALTSILLDALH